jgi:putative PIN family toxin of toxin-antitoxin system
VRVVLDTNVIVSGLLSPFGAPAQILRMVASGLVVVCYDARILSEYREVLLSPKFSFNEEWVEALLDQIEGDGIAATGAPLPHGLPDRDDEVFLEVALAGHADALVTGNIRHYPEESRQGVLVLPPRAFLDRYGTEQKPTE